MPKGVHIFILLIVACCRVVSIAAPYVQQSPDVVAAWHDQECNTEDSEVEKAKQEYKEESWLAHISLAEQSFSVAGFAVFSDNNLLEHTRKPVIPPPNVA